MWNAKYNGELKDFKCKADAFKWLNEVPTDIDAINLYFDTDKMFVKNVFGIFDCMTQSYVKGNLPVEYYN